METANHVDEIEASCDLSFEQGWWKIQRITWVILGLLLLGGILGLFGNGPLSKTTIDPSGGQVSIRYERLARRETPANLELHVQKPATSTGKVRVRLNRELVDRLQIKNIVPTPVATEPLADGARFIFQTDPAHDAATIVFVENPTTPGIVEGEVTVEGAETVRFRQFVYP